MASKRKQEALKKPFWQNKVLLICLGIVLIFGVFYYTQRGGSTLTPKPYEYNPTTNKYWDPEHKHWHDGPPPFTPTGTTGASTQQPMIPPATSATNQSPVNAPKPYEYNPVTDQYWDPGHNHWHNGKPPSAESQKVLTPVAPAVTDTASHKPYEYDPVKNQYWDPQHRHWHNGKPPDQTAVPPISPGGK